MDTNGGMVTQIRTLQRDEHHTLVLLKKNQKAGIAMLGKSLNDYSCNDDMNTTDIQDWYFSEIFKIVTWQYVLCMPY